MRVDFSCLSPGAKFTLADQVLGQQIINKGNMLKNVWQFVTNAATLML
jgi:hypothetical protein